MRLQMPTTALSLHAPTVSGGRVGSSNAPFLGRSLVGMENSHPHSALMRSLLPAPPPLGLHRDHGQNRDFYALLTVMKHRQKKPDKTEDLHTTKVSSHSIQSIGV